MTGSLMRPQRFTDHCPPAAASFDVRAFHRRDGGPQPKLAQSREHLHVIVKARPLKSGIAHDGVEMYTSGRFFTMTGEVL